MDIEKNISNLKKYINEDEIYRSYKEKTETYFSDFDMFCIKHCKDIENMLAEREKDKARIKELEEANTQLASKLAETEVNYENLKEIEADHQKEIGKLEVELSKAEKVIDLMAEEIAKQITLTCPYEDYNCYLDCENRCTNNEKIYAECWKKYFESKVGGNDND